MLGSESERVLCLDSPIGPIILLLRRGVEYPTLRDAIIGVGGADKIAAGADDDIVCACAKDCKAKVIACPIKTLWPLDTVASLHNLASQIRENRGYLGSDPRPRQPPTIRQMFDFIDSRVDQ